MTTVTKSIGGAQQSSRNIRRLNVFFAGDPEAV
jgi:hypothetical protein